ncbi:NAD-dependent epimerase/dehydratase family protein [Xenophilus sp. Marseille-Q4582]|uniref:NAD-dependent epimerase/dehydratase family protein n=1 Tax=Xenophilus sp. Marseille-Q4582 TaxID=2866600 RepID=UPI001CE4AB53|nr:NAD-dependent epimerase/dehydratase family protein [Xenophilus sp. Marseille-Q4582]
MPSNTQPLGALPARFRRQRLLIVGCGDIGLRVLRRVGARMRVMALTSSPERAPALRAAGAVPLLGDLDAPATLRRLAGLGLCVLHLAPPAREEGADAGRDRRTEALMNTLRLRTPPRVLVYGSTSGVYGDCAGARVPETRALRAATARAQRRVDAEQRVRWLGRSAGVRASILRIPGIYAPDREGGTPHARLLRGTPVLRAEDDVYTNHIHADDLAGACVAALYRGRPQRVFNVNDDSDLKMGDYFDLAADLYGLPRPRRVSRAQAQQQLAPLLLSFMGESRRLDNTRMKRELRLALRHSTVRHGLR